MAVVDEPIALLDRTDWDFPRGGTSPSSIHAAHWFPGNFIAQIPATLIEILTSPGAVVADPFAGSGTTGIEAARLGRDSVLIDSVLACQLVCEGKISLYCNPLTEDVLECVRSRFQFPGQCRSDLEGNHGEGGDEQLENWYSADTLAQLRYIWSVVENAKNETQKILRLAFSDVLFACAAPGDATTSSGKKRRHHWGWVADNVKPKELKQHDAIGEFLTRLDKYANFPSAPIQSSKPAFFRADARALPVQDESVDAIVTSPPYLGMIDYSHANRLLYLWMGWDLLADRSAEIGARYRRNRKNARSEYLQEMRDCWTELARILRPNGYCAVVIGESRKYPFAAQQCMDDLSRHLTLIWGPVDRHTSRSRVAERAARPTTEKIFVFQKQCKL